MLQSKLVKLLAANPSAQLLLWCVAGTAVVHLEIRRATTDNPFSFSPIFRYLLQAYDAHGNLLLLGVAAAAFLLRGRDGALVLVRLAASRPWMLALLAFALLCAGSLGVYRNRPLSMDEYAVLFQAKAFAAGRLSGQFPPELLDDLVPRFFQGMFLSVSRATGEVSSTYWPGFALLLAPFAWLGIPWAANPAISALTLPVVHRLAYRVTGSADGAGWALLLTAASPAFVLNGVSFYSMPAHLLCNSLYALLLLQGTARAALLAGVVGSLAATLHQPLAHLLLAAPFAAWLLYRRDVRVLAALAAGYLPLSLLLGAGWHVHLIHLAHLGAAADLTPAVAAGSMSDRFAAALSLPRASVIEARIAGLAKLWAWGAAGLLVLAAWGYAARRSHSDARLLAAGLVATFAGYLFFSGDQGHGWGFRYLHSAWFALPVLAACALAQGGDENAARLRRMAAWAAALSLVLANALRLAQADSFVERHLRQVPPLARAPDPAKAELVLVNISHGFYAQDMVQNDPFLRGPRVTAMYRGAEREAWLAQTRFAGYVKREEGPWGALWQRNR